MRYGTLPGSIQYPSVCGATGGRVAAPRTRSDPRKYSEGRFRILPEGARGVPRTASGVMDDSAE